MSRRRSFTLSETELQVVEQAISSHPEAEVMKRAMALRWLHLGHRPQAVAKMLVVNSSTIYNWCRRWAAEGLDGLVNRPKSGRPRKADERYCHLLEEALETDPAAYGYNFTIWTADRLRAHLEEQTGIRLSRGRFALLMEDLGYVYRRPKRDLASKQDQEAKQQAADLLDELKKGQKVVISSFSLWTKRP
jgi:putative transposase